MPPLSVTDPGGNVNDLGSVGIGVDEFQAALVELQRYVLLAGVAGVDAEDDALKRETKSGYFHVYRFCFTIGPTLHS